MDSTILTYKEHVGFEKIELVETNYDTSRLLKDQYCHRFQKLHRGKKKEENCFKLRRIERDENKFSVETGYYIGIDWIIKKELAIQVEPKLNNIEQVDYLQMLFSCIRHPEVTDKITQLFEIKWDQPKIKIAQQQDLLTPFLILEFLGVLRKIAKKGLRKSYYQVEKNLYGKVKGKVLVSKTIKHNHLKNKQLSTYCSFDEFGINNKENRFLKKTFEFCKKYLPQFHRITETKDLQDLYNFINPAFNAVSADIDIKELKTYRSNSFFKEYDEALRLARLIFQRFGYNLSKTADETIETPPFWIDMSKLFEFYVLGLLKDQFHQDVIFQYKPDGSNELDYLLTRKDSEMVIDAKYKPKYGFQNGKNEIDIRQVSGYARLKKVYSELFGNDEYNEIINGLIIYPNQESGFEILEDVDLKTEVIESYINMYKLGIKLPKVKSNI